MLGICTEFQHDWQDKAEKHTAKDISRKIDAATRGGKAGLADRTGADKGGHAKLNVKSMQIHHEARHPKLPFDAEKLSDLHVNISIDKPKPGVRGSLKK
ncbi:hypothetical protein KP509_11G029300 [Ceratopteris richardii]|uniref:Uncharacterized protein n=1 Tax=Ceratopteris richardii TaxID=49495 RepID=A0A8T2TT16_CERRI|nr:hypothetical protein KP509_11G029300 [Ceratopteris richardii]